MTEERKHAILFAATLLSARKLIDIMDSDRPNFAGVFRGQGDRGSGIHPGADR
jgi:hypothetical protein